MQQKNSDKSIQLSIGGQIFQTKLETLLQKKDSKLYEMLSKYDCQSQEQYFIDRDGSQFKYILNYLRDENCILPQNASDLRELLVEVKFYKIDSLQLKVSNLLSKNQTEINYIQLLQIINAASKPLALPNINFRMIELLQDLDFSNACLKECNFDNCMIINCSFKKALLDNSVILKCKVMGCNFDEAILDGCNLQQSQLNDNSFQYCSFKEANIANCQIQQANLSNCNFHGAVLNKVQLQGSDLTNSDFHLANIKSANFEKANITNCKRLVIVSQGLVQ